tara:strand:+ start:629 stop:2149 length:1521 start_codon:yes stop_codon:yes gene_type:complete
MKKFKTLTEIYSLINEVMPPLPNSPTQSVLINEWTITAADDVGGTVDLGDVDEKFYNRLRKDIINHRGGAKDLIEKLVNGGHWSAGMKTSEYHDKILLPAMEAFINIPDDIDINGLKHLIKDKKSLTGFRDDLIEAIDKNTSFNYNSSLEEAASTAFKGNVSELVSKLFALDYQQSGVSVGKGELVATLFSNATKGKKGDLYIDGLGEVEVKGTKGRPGKTGGTAYSAMKRLPQMLKDKGQNIFTGKEIQKYLADLTSSINELRSYISTQIEKNEADVGNNLTELVDYIEEFTEPGNQQNITYQDLFEFKFNLQKGINGSGLRGQQLKAAKNKLEKLTNAFQDFIKSKDRKTLTPDEQSYSWGDIVKQYFLGDWGLSKDDLIDGFVVLANEDINSQTEGELREALDVILDNKTLNTLSGPAGKKTLSAIVGTIHSVLYHEHEKFPIMLLVNSSTHQALPLTYEGDNITEKMINHYDTISSLVGNGELRITLSLDPRNKGISFEFTK